MSVIEFARDLESDQRVTDNPDDALPVKMNSLLAGELQQFNRHAGGPIVQYKLVTSAATGLNIASGPGIFYGIFLIAAGAVAAVHDATTATGASVVPAAGTASYHFNGAGILMNTGITVAWTSGTWLALYVPAA